MLVPCGARDPGRLLCGLNMTAFRRLAGRCPARRGGWSVWSLAGWLQAGPGRGVVVSAGGRPLRLVRWPGARYSVGAVEVPAGFPAGERAAGLTGRRAECGVLDRLVEAVQAGESRVLVAVGEPGVGKTALLECDATDPAARRCRAPGEGGAADRLLGQPALVVERAVRGPPGVAGHRGSRNRRIWTGHRGRCP